MVESPGDKRNRWQIHRSHKAWLLNNIPSSFLGNADLGSLLSKEAKHPPSEEKASFSLPLLSYGEISNATNPTRITECPALAMAVGDTGHILRIVRLEHHSWTWTEDENVSLRLGTAESTDEGHWCGNGISITQIKFAIHRKRYNPTRWLLVQTPTSTVVFEPELQKIPVSRPHSCCGYVAQGPSYISANPIISLTIKQTGGNPHSDVSFTPELGARLPQLAIIDQGGNWSIWDITGNRRMRERPLSLILRICGNFITGPISDLPLTGVSGGEPYKIMWLTRSKSLAPGVEVPDGPLKRSLGRVSGLMKTDNRRSEVVVLCSPTTLEVIDVDQGQPCLTYNMVRNNKADAILDIQGCTVDSSKVLVLTTTTLFWIDLITSDSGNASGGTAEHLKTAHSANHPRILMSCPHLMDQGDETLKLSIAPTAMSGDQNGYLVLIYSSISPQVAVFWFVESDSGVLARFHQQPFRFTQRAVTPGETSSLRTIVTLPRDFLQDQDGGLPGPGQEYLEEGFRLFQIIALGTDLSLRSCLCATGYEQENLNLPLLRKNPSRPSSRRSVALQHFGNSFVVPDDFDEKTILREPLSQLDRRSLYQFAATSSKPLVVDLSHIVGLLSTKFAESIHGFGEGS